MGWQVRPRVSIYLTYIARQNTFNVKWAYIIRGGLLSPLTLAAVSVSAILYVAIFSGPGRFTINSVSIGACNDIIKVTYMEVSRVTIYSQRLYSMM